MYASLGLRLIVECSYHFNAPFGVLVNEHIPCLSLKCMNFAVGPLSLRFWGQIITDLQVSCG